MSHLPDGDLIRAIDGELSGLRTEEVQAHLAVCPNCRARLGELERVSAAFVELRESARLPRPDPGRAMLAARMAEMSAPSAMSGWQDLWSLVRQHQVQVLVCSIALLVVSAGFLLFRESAPVVEARAIPDPRLTPGAVLPVTRADVCASGADESARSVPPATAQAVFLAYGIRKPQPKAYEVDYLITPALGGSDNVRNFWPQSYRGTVWNAHIKDALEDHLHRLVCAGQLALADAQQDISRNWVAAYRKYFHTDSPLPEHAGFLKDRPWE